MQKKSCDRNLFISHTVALLLLKSVRTSLPSCPNKISRFPNQHNKEAKQAHKVGMMFTHVGLTGAPILALFSKNIKQEIQIILKNQGARGRKKQGRKMVNPKMCNRDWGTTTGGLQPIVMVGSIPP